MRYPFETGEVSRLVELNESTRFSGRYALVRWIELDLEPDTLVTRLKARIPASTCFYGGWIEETAFLGASTAQSTFEGRRSLKRRGDPVGGHTDEYVVLFHFPASVGKNPRRL